jgi:hypothetical protein
MPQAKRLFCRLQLDLEIMGAIDTEDAARRLARVILSDIDLYIRERPRPGESREAQIEEGRRLFATRVTPALVPVFAMVLADRAAGRVNAPAVVPAPAIPASGAAASAGPVDSSPASSSEFEDAPATDPSIFVPPLEDPSPPPPPPAATEALAAVAHGRPVAPPAPEIPTPVPSAPVPPAPVPTARVSIPRLLAVVSVVAAIVAVFRLFFR